LLEGLQGFPTLKQIVSLNIGLKRIISDYNQGHIIRELRTRDCGVERAHNKTTHLKIISTDKCLLTLDLHLQFQDIFGLN
jgi:hypothetical protein